MSEQQERNIIKELIDNHDRIEQDAISDTELHEDIFSPSKLTMAVLATPNMANFGGVVHGGELLKLLDQVAYACATRYSGKYMVTVSVENMQFKHPVPIGSLIIFLASINYTGKTSCEVGIKVISENLENRYVTHCNSCYFNMVAKDKVTGKKCEIPQFIPRTADEKRRFEAAKKRRTISTGK